MALAEVGCAGILVADTFCGPMEVLPREGELLALDAMPSKAGGCAANVSIGLSKQGIVADVAGCLGRDPAAQVVLNALHGVGVGCEHVVFSDTKATSQTVILLVKGQDRRYLHSFGANAEFSMTHINFAWLTQLKVFYLGGLFALPSVRTAELLDVLRFCRAKGIITIVDVVIPQYVKGLGGLEELLAYIDYFVPNQDEARLLTGLADSLDQIRALRAYAASTVIITCGETGAVAARGSDVWHVDAFRVAGVDPSGSGDAFSAGLVTGILRGWDMPQTLTYASALGASATRAIGTTDGVFTAVEAEAFLREHTLNTKHEALGNEG